MQSLSLSLASRRPLRRAHQRYNAADIQEEEVVVEGRVLQPAEERAGEEVRDPKVCHQAGQETAGRHAGPDRRSGKRQHLTP